MQDPLFRLVMAVDGAGGMDLSYAPPFSPVCDPVLLAAGNAAFEV